MSNWQWDVFIDAFTIIIKGLWITAGLTVASFIFALIFGFVWTFLRRVPFIPFQFVAVLFMEFIRSTPPFVLLVVIYYSFPQLPLVGMTLRRFVSGMTGLALHISTYISEVYRSGIEEIDERQLEAATALNIPTYKKWTKIIL